MLNFPARSWVQTTRRRLQGLERRDRLTLKVRENLLRRTKDNTIRDQLPKKTDNIVLCRLSAAQERAYKRVRTDWLAVLYPAQAGRFANEFRACGVCFIAAAGVSGLPDAHHR